MTTKVPDATRRRFEHRGSYLHFKVAESKKRIYQRAAAITGGSLTAFAISAMDALAEAVIREHGTTVLTPEESVTLIDLMSAPLAPNGRLAARLAEYDAYIGDDA